MNKVEFYKLVDHPENLNEDTARELEKLTIEFPFFQAGWMLYVKTLKITGSPEYENALKKAALIVPDRKKLYRFLNDEEISKSSVVSKKDDSSSGYSLPEGETSDSGNSLIDKFLSSSPGPIRLEKDKLNNEQGSTENEMIEKSESENDELITETLAMIYFEQKKYDKALEAFRKLSLKYPEKSIYFATRIEEIEKLKNI